VVAVGLTDAVAVGVGGVLVAVGVGVGEAVAVGVEVEDTVGVGVGVGDMVGVSAPTTMTSHPPVPLNGWNRSSASPMNGMQLLTLSLVFPWTFPTTG